MDLRHQGLDAPVEDFGEAGVLATLLHRHAGIAQRAGGAAGGQDLDPPCGEEAAEFDQARLVRDGEKGAAEGEEVAHGGAHRPGGAGLQPRLPGHAVVECATGRIQGCRPGLLSRRGLPSRVFSRAAKVPAGAGDGVPIHAPRAAAIRPPWPRRTAGGPHSPPRPFGPRGGTSCAWSVAGPERMAPPRCPGGAANQGGFGPRRAFGAGPVSPDPAGTPDRDLPRRRAPADGTPWRGPQGVAPRARSASAHRLRHRRQAQHQPAEQARRGATRR